MAFGVTINIPLPKAVTPANTLLTGVPVYFTDEDGNPVTSSDVNDDGVMMVLAGATFDTLNPIASGAAIGGVQSDGSISYQLTPAITTPIDSGLLLAFVLFDTEFERGLDVSTPFAFLISPVIPDAPDVWNYEAP